MGDSNLKKLFSQKSNKFLSAKDLTELGQEAESRSYITNYSIDKNRFVPPVNFDKPENFARFGSAESYYTDSVERVYKTYPYDGSRAEQLDYENSSSYLDRWILETRYPKSTGYVNFNTAPTNTWIAANNPTIKEYIHCYGGPGTGSVPLSGKPLAQTVAGTNVYDAAKNRESNLKFDFDEGLTFECWAIMGDTDGSNVFQTMFHLGNPVGDLPGHGSLWIYRFGGGFSAYLYQPGAGATYAMPLYNTGHGFDPLSPRAWHHYAFSFKNETGGIMAKVYVDGKFVTSYLHTGIPVIPAPETTGSLQASVGGMFDELRTATASTTFGTGWCKMSGSIDEVRYWKTERNAEQIGRHWLSQVGGGSNNDDANTDLGVYYKFNEGIVGNSTVDSIALDYSGRVTNGTWTGYDSTYSRNTGSAIVSASAAPFEREDPIIHSSHPKVSALLAELKISGSTYDRLNNSSIYQSIPGWITEEDDGSQKALTQIMSSYLDTLQLQIEHLPKIKDATYLSSSAFKPAPFTDALLDSAGFVSPELFVDASVLEEFFNRTDKTLFDDELHDIKNLIYQNVYNNLVYIYKSKGTEKAFRNLVRCYGIGDDLVKLNIYADKSTYTYENNFESTSEKKNVIDFNKSNNFEASVYQSTSSIDSNAVAFISGSSNFSYIPRTIEANVLFPKKRKVNEKGYIYTPFVSASLFGMHTSLSTGAENPTWVTPDVGNFQVYAIKNKKESPSVRFKLTGTAGGGMPSLTTDLFEDVYDNQNWNISVRVKPTKYAASDFVAGSSVTTYDVVFSGYNNILDITYNTFSLTGTMTQAFGEAFLAASHRIYIGAHRTNFTGSLLQNSDVRVAATRYWMDYLENEELIAHIRDPLNYGRKHPYRSAYPIMGPIALLRIRVPQEDTLTLNWDFQQVTSSTTTGTFRVDDFSSGSVARANQMYGLLGPVLLKNHPGSGVGFPASSTDVVDVDYLWSAQQSLPENVYSSDMVQVLNDDDITFTRDSRPVRHFFAFEKSMYDTISQEMLDMFSTVKDFGNLVGNPVNRYREHYKDLTKLRNLFFERIGNTPNLDKYVEFYRWIDSSLGYMINQLIPASADFADNVRTMVESHILERSKYKTKFPTLDTKLGLKGEPDASGDVGGGPSGGTHEPAWASSHRPEPVAIDATEPGQDQNCPWWNRRADRTNPVISSGDALVDANRNVILDVTLNTNRRADRAPYSFDTSRTEILHGGINYSEDKMLGYVEQETVFGSADGAVTVWGDSLLSSSCIDDLSLEKTIQVHGKVTSLDDPNGIKSEIATPFTMVQRDGEKPSGDYNTKIIDNFASNVIVTNLHSDGIEIPMQGPFTEAHVGGRQVRHEPITTTPDASGVRPEAWRLDVASERLTFSHPPLQSPRARYPRDPTAKRPLNIKNISYTTASVTLGNYNKNYQVVNTTDRTVNNLAFVQDGGFSQTTPENQFLFQENATAPLDGKINFALPSRALDNGSFTKTVIASRFNAPGGKDVSSPGVLNPASEEYASMNALPWRNRVVRKALQDDLTVHTGQFGTYPYQQYGLRFDGVSDVFKVNSSSDSAIDDLGIVSSGALTSFTISFWIRVFPGDIGTTIDTIVGVERTDVFNNLTFAIKIDPTTRKLYMDNLTSDRFETSAEAIDDGKWHHYAFVSELIPGSHWELYIYKDGVDVTPASNNTFYVYYSLNIMSLGALYTTVGPSYTQNGKFDLDEVAVWNTNIGTGSAPNITGIYNSGHPGDLKKHGSVANLQAWWRMGDDISVIHDSKGENHGELHLRGGAVVGTSQQVVTDVLRRQESLVTGSFEKVNRNPLWRIEYGQPNDVTIETVTYDNGYVTHPIPRSDTQYRWIRDSYQSSKTYGHATSSSDITFVDIGEISVLEQLGTYSNNLVYEPVYAQEVELSAKEFNRGYFQDALILGVSSVAGQSPAEYPGALNSYVNTHNLGATPSVGADYFNVLITSRNGLGGFSTWKQIRNREHPITRHLIANNYYTYTESKFDLDGAPYKGVSPKGASIYSWPDSINPKSVTSCKQKTYFVAEPPVSYNGAPVVVEYYDSNGKYTSAFSFENQLDTFANDVLLNAFNIEIKMPKAYNTFLETFKSDSEIQLSKLAMRNFIYPRAINTTLAKVRSRLQYAETAAEQRAVDTGQNRLFWRDTLTDRLKNPDGLTASSVDFNTSLGTNSRRQHYNAATLANLGTSFDTGASSIWPLDKNVAVYLGAGYKAGELAQDTRLSIGFEPGAGTPYSTPTQQYALSGTGGKGISQTLNELVWSADTQSGKKPWFDSYEEYAADIRNLGSSYTITPEFKMSDHMDYILNAGPDAELNNFLSIQGAGTSTNDLNVSAPSETADYTGDFFTTYVHSDFMKYFGQVKQDYQGLAQPSKMALECKVIKKLLPYQGFYPATRCLQLGTLFSSSHGKYLSGLSTITSEEERDYLAAITQPLFGPGILYNSIKAGFGYGWPIWTTQPTFTTPISHSSGPLYAPQNQKWKGATGSILNIINSAPDTQLRFEDLLLEGLPLNSNIYMLRRKLTGSVHGGGFRNNAYKQVAGKLRQLGSDSYVRAMHNFLAEVGNTFLENEGFGTYKSQERLNWKPMKSGETYYMDVAIYKTTDMIQAEGPTSGAAEWTRGSMYGFPGLNEGTPGATLDQDPRFAMFTPPGFYGNKEYVTIAYTADPLDELLPPPISKIAVSASRTYTLDQTDSADYTPNPISLVAGILYNNRFTVTSSLELFNTSRAQDNTYDNQGKLSGVGEAAGDKDDNNVWVINTKCEFPTLNFRDAGTSSEVRGMWGQNGEFLTADEGVFFAIQESAEYTKQTAAGAKSLVQVCGFDTTPRRIGDVASKKIISEAVVAIPFTLIKSGKNKGKKKFIKINKTTLNRQMKNKAQTGFALPDDNVLDTSITSMMAQLEKYVMPPNMDFLRNKKVDPFVTYLFEFEHELSRQDLADIWQGLMPNISRNSEVGTAKFAHDLSKNEFFHGKALPDDLRWMVFKIKRRAKNNYYGAKRDAIDAGVRSTPLKSQNAREFDYSYNWPHDFYSLVELTQVEAGVEFGCVKEENLQAFQAADKCATPGDEQ